MYLKIVYCFISAIGIARMNMGIYEGAIGYFEQQLATLEQLSSHTSLIDKVNKK